MPLSGNVQVISCDHGEASLLRKFAGDTYTIDADEERKHRNRIYALKKTLKSKQTVHLTMVTTYGITPGKHSGIVQRQVTMDDFFD